MGLTLNRSLPPALPPLPRSKPLCRKLVIVEGIYANYGDLAPLDRIWPIKDKYKYRLMVDESHAFGVLGATGRGACEHFGLQPSQVRAAAAGRRRRRRRGG